MSINSGMCNITPTTESLTSYVEPGNYYKGLYRPLNPGKLFFVIIIIIIPILMERAVSVSVGDDQLNPSLLTQ